MTHDEFTPERFHTLVGERIGDASLRHNVRRATDTSMKKRADVIRDYPDWEARRDAAAEVKRHVMAHLRHYLELFETQATAAGAVVHYARSGEDARAIVLDIARRSGARIAVKSKSMTSEEIELGRALAELGIDSVETDLGEYIVQIAGEPPSHITAPALHKSRDEIGALFARVLGIPFTNDPEELTAIARRVLREKFLGADLGISGVNFAVADSGAICIVENEANARMTTTLPRVHVALMGIEKLVPDMRSLTLLLSMLARSATGQRLSCYTNIIRGPRREGEWDGPDELHIVVLDNGRSGLHADPRLREVLHCIRCGACMNTCPVYRSIGGHAYGSVYSGPIGSIVTPALRGLSHAKDLPYASSLCGACTDVCPVRIDLHHHLLALRGRAVQSRLGHPLERLGMRLFVLGMTSPLLYRIGSALFRFAAPLFGDGEGGLSVPVWSATRRFPLPAEKSFRQLWKERTDERA